MHVPTQSAEKEKKSKTLNSDIVADELHQRQVLAKFNHLRVHGTEESVQIKTRHLINNEHIISRSWLTINENTNNYWLINELFS